MANEQVDIEITKTIHGREIGEHADRTKRWSKLAKRAREIGQRCDACGERLATTLVVSHVDDTAEYRCGQCAGHARPATADPDRLARYLALKGVQ
jgi:predicted SprT family Zn-dependent metalloprotease